MAKLEGHAFDCRRTLYLSFDHARRHPAAHAAAMARFLGGPSASKLRAFFAKTATPANGTVSIDCVARNKALLPRLGAYLAWLRATTANFTKPAGLPDPGCARGLGRVADACAGGDARRCAARWRERFAGCAAALARRYPTVAAVPPLTSCA